MKLSYYTLLYDVPTESGITLYIELDIPVVKLNIYEVTPITWS